MQTWPAGHSIAGKPHRDINDQELNLSGTAIGAGTLGDFFTLPWWEGGFAKCFLQIFFDMAATGPVQLLASPLGSDGTLSSVGGWELLQGGTAGPTWNTGSLCGLYLNFDDGLIPGNYIMLNNGAYVPAVSLTLNPVWNKAAFIRLQLLNGSAGALTFASGSRILLGGK
jgi:hypothetical protein